MNCKLILLFFLYLLKNILGFSKSYFDEYKNDKVYRLKLTKIEQVDLIKNLELSNKVDLWSEPKYFVSFVDVQVKPEFNQEFLGLIQKLDTNYSILVEDVSNLIKDNLFHFNSKVGIVNNFDYGDYHTLDDINNWMINLKNNYSNYLNVIELGQSYENRTINLLKLSIPNKNMQKKSIWIDAAIHSREWITTSTLLYITNQLLTNYNHDTNVTNILDNFNFYILPVFNVDGYVYTFTKQRLWRKTRSKSENSNCFGADPNRNWNNHHCEIGSSNDSCSDIYCGKSAFSEIEVKLVSDYILKNKNEIISYINLHSYSQYWMTPYGYSTNKPYGYYKLLEGAKKATDSIRSIFGTNYTYGNIANVIYMASGSSVDWAFDNVGIFYSYAVELRDNGKYGFLLPKEEILPCAKETFEGIKSLCNYIIEQEINNSSFTSKNNFILINLLLIILKLIIDY